MTTGKTIALTRWTFIGKVMSLLFNMQTEWLNNNFMLGTVSQPTNPLVHGKHLIFLEG